MDRFIRSENIQRFKKLLEIETDPDKRRIVEKLLAEEEAKVLSLKK